MYEDFFRRFVVGRSGRLLDMGAGLGFFLMLMARHPNWQSYGCEISSAAVRYARGTLGLANIECTKLDESKWPDNSFDIITMWDVLDHIPHPDPLLRRCHALLKDGGCCFIRVPNVALHLPRARVKKWISGMRPGLTYLQAREHPHHYSARAVRTVLTRNGFATVHFAHLRPVDDVRRNTLIARGARNAWFQAVRALAILSVGWLNYDNLFVVARKGTQTEICARADTIGLSVQ
jgi:SAM-dependent methyltransferase